MSPCQLEVVASLTGRDIIQHLSASQLRRGSDDAEVVLLAATEPFRRLSRAAFSRTMVGRLFCWPRPSRFDSPPYPPPRDCAWEESSPSRSTSVTLPGKQLDLLLGRRPGVRDLVTPSRVADRGREA
jgi:hypothetical protein